MGNYKNCNARPVLDKVEKAIAEYRKPLYIIAVCGDLSIFDWWKHELSLSNLKQMRSFLRNAIKLGYDGYVCFKVGSAGCAHGMWAHKEESTNGCSPEGDFLYHSFRSGDNYWDASIGGKLLCETVERSGLTLSELKKLIA